MPFIFIISSLTMSVSKDYPTTPDLYCTEVASNDFVYPNDDICNSTYFESPDSSSDEETYIAHLLHTELDQMPQSELPAKSLSIKENDTSRQAALKWMLKVHAYYRFRPETAYISVNYMDRFLSSHTPQGKGWPGQLLAVACLALAAKMEEIRVPPLLNLQILEPKFLFKPRTVQRMELLVMASLKWRLRIVTPFDFLHYFIAKLQCLGSSFYHCNEVCSQASHIILSTCQDFLGYPPSSIAAAALLCASNQKIDDPKLGCFHKGVNKEMVKKCLDLIHKITFQSSYTKQPNLAAEPPRPIGVLDAIICRNCDA